MSTRPSPDVAIRRASPAHAPWGMQRGGRMRGQLRPQEREMRMLQRAGVLTAWAETPADAHAGEGRIFAVSAMRCGEAPPRPRQVELARRKIDSVPSGMSALTCCCGAEPGLLGSPLRVGHRKHFDGLRTRSPRQQLRLPRPISLRANSLASFQPGYRLRRRIPPIF